MNTAGNNICGNSYEVCGVKCEDFLADSNLIFATVAVASIVFLSGCGCLYCYIPVVVVQIERKTPIAKTKRRSGMDSAWSGLVNESLNFAEHVESEARKRKWSCWEICCTQATMRGCAKRVKKMIAMIRHWVTPGMIFGSLIADAIVINRVYSKDKDNLILLHLSYAVLIVALLVTHAEVYFVLSKWKPEDKNPHWREKLFNIPAVNAIMVLIRYVPKSVPYRRRHFVVMGMHMTIQVFVSVPLYVINLAFMMEHYKEYRHSIYNQVALCFSLVALAVGPSQVLWDFYTRHNGWFYFKDRLFVGRFKFTYVLFLCFAPLLFIEVIHFIPLFIEYFMYKRLSLKVFNILLAFFFGAKIISLAYIYSGEYLLHYICKKVNEIRKVTKSELAVYFSIIVIMLMFMILPLIPACWILWSSKRDRDWNHKILMMYLVCAYGPMVYLLTLNVGQMTLVVLVSCGVLILWVSLYMKKFLHTADTILPRHDTRPIVAGLILQKEEQELMKIVKKGARGSQYSTNRSASLESAAIYSSLYGSSGEKYIALQEMDGCSAPRDRNPERSHALYGSAANVRPPKIGGFSQGRLFPNQRVRARHLGTWMTASILYEIEDDIYAIRFDINSDCQYEVDIDDLLPARSPLPGEEVFGRFTTDQDGKGDWRRGRIIDLFRSGSDICYRVEYECFPGRTYRLDEKEVRVKEFFEKEDNYEDSRRAVRRASADRLRCSGFGRRFSQATDDYVSLDDMGKSDTLKTAQEDFNDYLTEELYQSIQGRESAEDVSMRQREKSGHRVSMAFDQALPGQGSGRNDSPDTKDWKLWTNSEVVRWVEEIGLGQYAGDFKRINVEGAKLGSMKREDLSRFVSSEDDLDTFDRCITTLIHFNR